MSKKKEDSDSSQPELPHNVPIVAIGASAGGQEAVVELLENLSPTTGLAYVYIQHLDPTQESHLAHILGRVTEMVVLEAQHLMRIRPNYLYIIPPDRDLEVLDGVLTLVPRTARSVIHMPIDQFFLSLSERQKEGAIAIVLSGTASDGTLGLRAIKAAGGITFAQDDTARFQSMPRSAIAEGVVDRVLSPAAIAKELERLSKQTAIFQQTILTEAQETESLEASKTEPASSTDEDLRTIIQLLRRSTGMDFGQYKVTTIRRRIIRRTLLYKLDSLNEYADYLRNHPEEASLLYDDLLINVTTFFRDAETMDYVQKVLLPQLVKDKIPQEPIRVWVPACSTGQEAYSIAMLLLEVLGDRTLSRTIQIFATDLSESAVAKARMGSYTRGEIMDVSARRLQRFFTKIDDHYRINKAVRDICVFAPHNLLKDPPFSRLDLISCRNLLIYLETPLQRKAIVTFHYGLNPNGYLILGKSETVGTSAPLFSQVEKNYKIFARKNDVDSRATFTMAPRQLDGDSVMNRSVLTSKTIGQGNGESSGRIASSQGRWGGLASDLDKVVDNLLLNQYVPASVVVNQDLEILLFRGSTGLFLEPAPGKASLNLIKMARPSLVFELRNVIHKAQKLNEPVRKSNLEIKVKNKVHYVAIEAVPLETIGEERLFLIIFEEIEPPVVPTTRTADARNRRIKELEAELTNLREDMRSVIEEQEASNEELQSANEEIISSNEELQSINEELETSKEEIESTNEELLTINQELQVRNDQLSESYQFAEDIFGTIREATLVLDTDLRVKSANQAFYRLFQLHEEETERRLIYELGNRQWDIPELRLMLTDIITSDVQFLGFELTYTSVETGAKILSLNARRVVRQQESILLAIEDITEHRRAQQLVIEREAWFHQIADNAPTLIWVTDAQGNITFLNKEWINYTGRSLEEVKQHGWVEAFHPDDWAAYIKTYTTHVKAQQPFTVEYRLGRHDGDYHWMLENAQPLFGDNGLFNGYIGSVADVHLQTEMNRELDRRVQERATESEQTNLQIITFVENTPDAITRWDEDLKLLFANSAFVSQTGLPLDELLGKTNAEMGQPDAVAQPYMNKLRQTFRTKQPQEHVNELSTPNGTALYYSRIVPEFGPDGIVRSVLAIARDISDLEKAREQARENAFNLQVVLNSSQAAIGFLKPIRENDTITDFRLVVCNHEFARIAGLPIERLVSRPVSQLSDKLWQERTVEIVRHTLETGVPFMEERQDPGSGEWMLITLTKFDDGVVLTGQNITPLKEAGKQQSDLLNELEKSNKNIHILTRLRQQIRDRGEFLRTTSHDLRGNFGIIQGAATLLDIAGTDEERSIMLSMLQRNLQQATSMLTELLDVARLESGQEQRQIGVFDAAELLSGIEDSVRPLADERGLWLRKEGEKAFSVEGDAVKVHRIAQNLLLNALKYTKTGGVIVSWGAASDPDHWQLTITDTGPGLPQEAHSKSGEGIGLLIVRQLCELLNCQMEVDSQPGVGTRFQLTFPRSYNPI
ncbi:CheR family methyltransferase [Spirosoma validum]|uniref:PAS domain S-box protein n=1 Tax=Spirosoma validum TaxID=2771355 RepID=A0A927GD80_9BACT|nr:CheR family methyltransferase [Spirosoma validum]MBD2753398.1 PAS domain S-box protein [Spirosoma validum]